MKTTINCMLLAFLLGTGISVSAFAQEKPLAADELASRIVDREDAGDFDGALDYVKQLKQTAPAYSYNLVYDLEGGIKLDLNDLDEAMSDYNKAIESDPPFGSYYIHRGYLKQFQGDVPGHQKGSQGPRCLL
jgi:tetratricopeptide (TPR) repeat protein